MKQEPERKPPLVDGITIFFLALTIVSGVSLWALQGPERMLAALGDGLSLLLGIIPLILFAILLAAYVQRMIPVSLAERWLGGRSGVRGLILATVAGALTPGGPFSAFPVVVGLYRAGASLPVCVTYLTAWSVLGLQRVLVWEVAFFGTGFVLLRLAVSLPLPPLAGLIAMALVKRGGGAR